MAATLDEVIDSLLDNADFEETGSASKARTFITAANRYFILQPQSASDQSSSLSMGLPQVQALMQRAQAYVSANSASVTFVNVNTGDFR